MASEATAAEGAIRLKRTFTASPERVFDAWTNPAKLTKWFGVAAPDQLPTKIITVDVRVGGRYEVLITSPTGKEYRMRGTYREVRPPEKLVFTWSWEGGDFQDSVVTIELRRLGQSNFTELSITHELLPESQREGHTKGWIGCFDTLEAVLKAEA